MASTKSKVFLAILVLTCASVFAAERTSIWQRIEPKAGPRDLAILFNTDDILLDIEGIQGGVGMKVGLKSCTLRWMADLLFTTDFDTISASLGAVLEKHLWPGPVSVYWGPSVEAGFTSILSFKTDEDNWSRIGTVPLSVGLVLGIELFIFEFLSVFAEYQAAVDLGWNTTTVSTAGSVSSTTELTYNVDLGMGNNAKLGIVFYFVRRKSETGVSADEEEPTK